MSRADYAHWNEDADRIWWEEEGKHSDEIHREPWDDPEFYNETMGRADVFAEEIAEWDEDTILAHLNDREYCKKWPKAEKLLLKEINRRRNF